MGSLQRTVTEKFGAAIFVFGISLAGFAADIYAEPKNPSTFGIVSGFVIAALGLVTWWIGYRSHRQ